MRKTTTRLQTRGRPRKSLVSERGLCTRRRSIVLLSTDAVLCSSGAELIRHINDPEHPLTLEQLNVAQLKLVQCNDTNSTIDLNFTPTIPVSAI
jgi:hypothetical protein